MSQFASIGVRMPFAYSRTSFPQQHARGMAVEPFTAQNGAGLAVGAAAQQPRPSAGPAGSAMQAAPANHSSKAEAASAVEETKPRKAKNIATAMALSDLLGRVQVSGAKDSSEKDMMDELKKLLISTRQSVINKINKAHEASFNKSPADAIRFLKAAFQEIMTLFGLFKTVLKQLGGTASPELSGMGQEIKNMINMVTKMVSETITGNGVFLGENGAKDLLQADAEKKDGDVEGGEADTSAHQAVGLHSRGEAKGNAGLACQQMREAAQYLLERADYNSQPPKNEDAVGNKKRHELDPTTPQEDMDKAQAIMILLENFEENSGLDGKMQKIRKNLGNTKNSN